MMSKELLIDNNKYLVGKINKLRNEIEKIQEQNMESYKERCSMESSDDEEEKSDGFFREESLEPIPDMVNRREATEELLGITFVNHASKDLASHDLPPGRWREVTIDVLILGWLKGSISFIESAKDNANAVLSMKWSVRGRLARSELSTLNEHSQNDLSGLLIKLRDYAQLAQDRSDILDEFYSCHNDYSVIQPTEEGILLKWNGNLFQILWTVKLCKYTEQIVPFLEMEVSEKDDFIRQSSKIFEELTSVHQTKQGRRDALMELATIAIAFTDS